MDNRWYPVAISVVILGCGADVDGGAPAATGGAPNNYYGPLLGGATSINTGAPNTTGGYPPSFYGMRLPTGGAASNGGATTDVGGRNSIDAGTPAATGGRQIVPVYGVIAPTISDPPQK